MKEISPATSLAWKIAAFEAFHARAGLIGPEHLFIGICSLEKGLPAGNPKDSTDAQAIEEELGAIGSAVAAAGLEARDLRRRIRQVPGPVGAPACTDRTLHRSPAARACFDRARALADGGGITCIHIGIAVLENPGPVLLHIFDRLDAMQDPAGGSPMPVRDRLLAVFRDCLTAHDTTLRLEADIGHSQKSLAGLSRHSAAYRMLRTELAARTLLMARTCLDCGDEARLVYALRGLEPVSGDRAGELSSMIAQLAFLNAEGISLSEGSKTQVRDLLRTLELQIAGGAA